MPRAALFRSLKVVSWVVLLLMLVALGYAVFTSLRYWSGIGV
ncbi:MAG TPA: hypothetical protein VF339_09940 [Gammaproteobacteria bacterium]